MATSKQTAQWEGRSCDTLVYLHWQQQPWARIAVWHKRLAVHSAFSWSHLPPERSPRPFHDDAAHSHSLKSLVLDILLRRKVMQLPQQSQALFIFAEGGQYHLWAPCLNPNKRQGSSQAHSGLLWRWHSVFVLIAKFISLKASERDKEILLVRAVLKPRDRNSIWVFHAGGKHPSSWGHPLMHPRHISTEQPAHKQFWCKMLPSQMEA